MIRKDSKVPETREREMTCMQILVLPSQWKIFRAPGQDRIMVQTVTNWAQEEMKDEANQRQVSRIQYDEGVVAQASVKEDMFRHTGR